LHPLLADGSLHSLLAASRGIGLRPQEKRDVEKRDPFDRVTCPKENIEKRVPSGQYDF